uniref:DNA-(apurinic or apyrimidinic site) endonuclease n=1 Tax=Eptatretus burgeri TaxID=7764 RepID=A0A8C4R617_EPTBU
MEIVSWNINGVRTTRVDETQGSSLKVLLDSLRADVICLQETNQLLTDLLDEPTAIVEGYNAYFSFSRARNGYSGVVTYCKNSAIPIAAEEGLSGLLVGHGNSVGCYGDMSDFSTNELQALDAEGRAVITQHHIVVEGGAETVTVVNVYCPRADPERPDRAAFKLRFYKLLQLRVEAILSSGSHVVLLGDMNTAHQLGDHCDPDDPVSETRLLENDSCAPKSVSGGHFVDAFRLLHPNLEGAYTCWSAVTGARATNYGTRIDYVFLDRHLAQRALVACTIDSDVYGSDHCPVRATLRCSLVPACHVPPLCARLMPEFSGRQQKIGAYLLSKPCSRLSTVSSRGVNVSEVVEVRSASHSALSKRASECRKVKGANSGGQCSQEVRIGSKTGGCCASQAEKNGGAAFWKTLLAGPPPPPLCPGHGEAAVLRTVKKSGPNQGRRFYVCARPAGHAHNPAARCDFFQWTKR